MNVARETTPKPPSLSSKDKGRVLPETKETQGRSIHSTQSAQAETSSPPPEELVQGVRTSGSDGSD